MKIDKERKAFLINELKEYEKTHPMSDDDREALMAWINFGNSTGNDFITKRYHCFRFVST